MSDALHDRWATEIAARNARLRAWQAYGLRFQGAWRYDRGAWVFSVACDECGGWINEYLGRDLLDPLKVERVAIGELDEYHRCRHLQTLAGSDPDEVVALMTSPRSGG